MLGAGKMNVDEGGLQSGEAQGLWAWTAGPTETGPPNKPCKLSEPQFPGLQNGNISLGEIIGHYTAQVGDLSFPGAWVGSFWRG